MSTGKSYSDEASQGRKSVHGLGQGSPSSQKWLTQLRQRSKDKDLQLGNIPEKQGGSSQLGVLRLLPLKGLAVAVLLGISSSASSTYHAGSQPYIPAQTIALVTGQCTQGAAPASTKASVPAWSNSLPETLHSSLPGHSGACTAAGRRGVCAHRVFSCP